jgi:hypothetical protein
MATLRETLKTLIDGLDEQEVRALYEVVAGLRAQAGGLSPERAALLEDILQQRRPLLDALAREERTVRE